MYDVVLRYNNGVVLRAQNISLDMFGDDDSETVYMYDKKGRNIADIKFKPCDAFYDTKKSAHVILPENLRVDYYCKHEYDDGEVMETSLKEAGVECVFITRRRAAGIHYAV